MREYCNHADVSHQQRSHCSYENRLEIRYIRVRAVCSAIVLEAHIFLVANRLS